MHNYFQRWSRRRLPLSLGAVAAATLLASCGGNDNDATVALTAAQSCSSLSGTTIPASSIGRPTAGARITTTALETTDGSSATVEYCKVTGEIAPVDPTAPPINFQLNLPTAWNGKAFQHGGGGYDGSVVTGTGPSPGASDVATPLARGYATFGSDSGHTGKAPFTGPASAFDASFALNDEALVNYSGDQIKKTRDVAVEVINRRYSSRPTKTYFAGGSGGGREAFVAAQRYTADYDGVIAYYPAWPLTEMLSQYSRQSNALARPGAYVTSAKAGLIYDSSITACDALDGVTDKLISNVKACQFNVSALRCPSGTDEGNTCLSDAQLGAVNTLTTPFRLSVPVASGETSFPGNSITSGADLRAAVGAMAPSYPPTTPAQPFPVVIGDGFVRYWVAKNPGLLSTTYDPENPGQFANRVSFLSSIIDANSTNLDQFRSKGAKLIIVHGNADAIIPAEISEVYYDRLRNRYGAGTRDFARFYEVPGYGHGNGGFTLSWDSVAALEGWVERGQAPEQQVARDLNAATRGRSRPLCEWPAWPKYQGSGDVNVASSYTCATS